MQLVNESHDAMYESHTKMDQIRLYTMSVPNFLKSAVQILAQGTTKQVEVMLPTHLKKIQETAVNCKALAFEVIVTKLLFSLKRFFVRWRRSI